MLPFRWTAWPTDSTSFCGAAAPPFSKTSCRVIELMTPTFPYLKETPSQTAGPYVHIGLIPHQAGFDLFGTNFSNVLNSSETKGERIRVEGRVFDGMGAPARDVLLEIWQANAAG